MKKTLLSFLFIVFTMISFGQTTAIERDSLAVAPEFQMRVRTLSLKSAGDILADTSRVSDWRFAQHIITHPTGGRWVNMMAYGVLTNQAVTAASTDSDLEFTINSIFPKYALAFVSAFNNP